MDRRRARSDLDKAERRADILEAARATIDGSEMDEFTMDAVAAKLGLAKGTLYRYFPTREAVLLGILGADLEGWFAHIDRRLAKAVGRAPVVSALVGTLIARPRLLRLLAVLPSVLEHNVPFATAHEFKSFLLHGSAGTGSLIDRALQARRPGSGCTCWCSSTRASSASTTAPTRHASWPPCWPSPSSHRCASTFAAS